MQLRSSTTKVQKIISWIPIILPIFTIYKGPFVDLGSFLLIIGFALALAVTFNGRIVIRNPEWLLYLLYIVLITFISLSYHHYTEPSQYLMRTIKYLLYSTFMLYTVEKGLFNLAYAKKMFIAMSIFATWFMILQTLLYYTVGYGLPGYPPSLITFELYADRALNIMNYGAFRPTSIFAEPAHYVTYVILALIMLLFGDDQDKRIIKSVFITIGIFLSTSGQGIFFALIVWVVWYFYSFGKRITYKQLFASVTILVVGVIAIIKFLSSQRGQYIISRVLGQGDYGNAIVARSTGYTFMFENTTSAIQKIFGMGFGNVDLVTFYSTWSFSLWCLGIVGTFIVLFIYIKRLAKTKSFEYRMIILVNMVMGVFSTLFLGVTMVQWFSFIMANEYMESNNHLRG